MKKIEPDLSTLSIEELNKRLKMTKLTTGMLAGILFLQFVIGVYLTIKQGFNIFIVLPVAFLPILVVNYTNIKKLNDEIAKRNG